MSGSGDWLRAAREARGYSLAEAERLTRIRAKLLAALEAEDLSAFASLAQARGFLRNYAEFLELDPEPLLTNLAPGKLKPAAGPAPRPTPAGAVPVSGGWRRLLTRDLLIGVLFTLVFGALLFWGAQQLWQTALSAPPASATAAASPAVTAAGALTPAGPSATPTLPEASPTAPLPTPRPNYVGVNVLVRAEQRLWLRALVDGAETFSGQMAPGDSREFVGNTVVELWTGNGKGTRVVFNGQDQGVLGGLGEVVIRLWTLAGAVTPTPTPPPTP